MSDFDDDAFADLTPMPDDQGAFGPDDGCPDAADELEAAQARTCSVMPLNDVGNGERFATYFGADALWVARVGWFAWTGKVWSKDPDEIGVRRLGQQLGPRILREIPYLVLDDWQMKLLAEEAELRGERDRQEKTTGEDGRQTAEAKERIGQIDVKLGRIADVKKTLGEMRKSHRNFARTAGNSARIDAALKEAGINLAHDIDALDAAPLDVNTSSGVLRFTVDAVKGDDGKITRYAERELLPHERSQLLTKIMPVEFDPDAECPRFMEFLNRVQPSAEMRRFLQRWFGLSLTALTGEQKLVFLYGMGANGKSVLMELMAKLAGDYATTAKIESLTGQNRRGGGDATPDLVPLMGARLVRASEPEEGARLQEGTIKELTGGEKILVRALHSDFVEVTPQFKLTISGNHKPEIRGTDDGIWRRLLLVPFDVQIPKDERDPDLVNKLWAERSGILNWLCEGLSEYLERGLQEPDLVLDATREFREQSDPMGAFLENCCVVTGSTQDSVSARDLRDAFSCWQFDQGEAQWGDGAIARRLKEKAGKWRSPSTGQGFAAFKASLMLYRGLRFNDVFKRRFDEMPRDHRGRPLFGATPLAETDA